jgi:predicted nucleic acid-binding protein
MARLVLTDASPLIGLSRVDGVAWLRALFGEVETTHTVFVELSAGSGPEAAIAEAIDAGWLTVSTRPSSASEPPQHLGPGEWSCIEAALEHNDRTLLLVDDRLARQEARRRGIRVAGTASLVGLAQRRGLIESAYDVFERLLQSDFRIAPSVVRAVLERLEQGPRGRL